MNKRNVFATARLFFGGLTLVAIGTQLGIHISHGYNVVNFFSYFTNLSNIFAAAMLLLFALKSFKNQTLSLLAKQLRGASVVYMIVVGIVFTTLLKDVELGSLLPWVNTLLHYVMPIVVVVDWLCDSHRLSYKTIFLWLTFPLVYLAYSMIRGTLTHFYAYPFLNPTQPNGYILVALYIICILVLFSIASTAVVFIGRWHRESRD